ncbi:MAG: UDP-galactopyranose mutase [Clostridiales Family XIII bacterium]|jgi:UDP-galactopyranose mutase|nr:UDP-galactopyranose mutase [Clostridiales Family XIII bacterium]
MKRYDYLIVGAGLFGAVCARELADAGKRCLVVEKRRHIGGNVYTENVGGIQVHVYGGHVFHTDAQPVWQYVNRFAAFNHYINMPLANYRGELYNLPFNMNTFYRMWGVRTPAEAKARIAEQVAEAGVTEPRNLEEQAIGMVGREIYGKLIKGYTEKQWGRTCKELPPFIIKRLPVRFRYDNNYFDDRWQGVPTDGYTAMIERMLDGVDVRTETDYFERRAELDALAEGLVFTGPIDRYYDYRYGELEWRSLRFETEELEIEDYQGVAAVNYTDAETPFTRIFEHKHFAFGTQPNTVITREYPQSWHRGREAYYPINDEKNQARYEKYAELAAREANAVFGGRQGHYRYYDMDKAVSAALETVARMKQK